MFTLKTVCLATIAISIVGIPAGAQVPGPHAIVYKTRKDYSKLVPVTLSADGKQIVSYPAPEDLKAGNRYLYPTRLHNGYLLDNKGIGPNTAFLNVSYERYARLKTAPSVAQLQRMILSRTPFKELCDCGPLNSYKAPTKELNAAIDKRELNRKCKRLK
ncbi:MAG: hypothetical protein JSS82_11720 [Bacteroidetes bacterium]|nr:hypothetical protein [Bacteroidota bacterium]